MLNSITVHPNNSFFTVVDNVLFSKDMTELVCYPLGLDKKTYTIPNGVNTISEHAFSHNRHLKTVQIANTVKEIQGHAFWDCSSLEIIDIPESVTSIGRWAFESCVYLRTIIIPSSVIYIGDEAFRDCGHFVEESFRELYVEENSYAYQYAKQHAPLNSYSWK